MSGNTRRVFSKLTYGFLTATGITTAAAISGYITGNETFYKSVLMPIVQHIDPEKAHVCGVRLASWGMLPRDRSPPEKLLETVVFGRFFSNPVGLAAGFDKHGECIDGMFKVGFGFVEIGSITPLPQSGNEKPRVFRLTEDQAIINRYGFNSIGHDAVILRLQERNKNLSTESDNVLGINLGKNKTSSDAVQDYVKGVQKFGKFADYLTINISSPNTPGLRSLQGKKELSLLIEKVKEARDGLPGNKPPILVKIDADSTPKTKEDIAKVVTTDPCKVDGLIVCNTTISRPDTLQSEHKHERGGLSGRPLRELSTQAIHDMYKLTEGQIPIIGVGGIANGRDAYDKIRAGASLVQVYSAIAYEGPPIVKKIKRELAELLRKDGLSSVSEAVGLDVTWTPSEC